MWVLVTKALKTPANARGVLTACLKGCGVALGGVSMLDTLAGDKSCPVSLVWGVEKGRCSRVGWGWRGGDRHTEQQPSTHRETVTGKTIFWIP